MIFESLVHLKKYIIILKDTDEECSTVVLPRGWKAPRIVEDKWKPPQLGQLTINVDAATKRERMLIVKDCFGSTLGIATRCAKGLTAELGALKALIWAATKQHHWKSLI